MKKSGFTLIELIIVLGIISIGSGIAILRFNVVDKIGARNEIQNFIDDYSYLRDLSLSTGTKNCMTFTDDYYITSGYIGKVRDLHYIKSLNTEEIEFYPNGFVNTKKIKEAYNLVFVSKKDPDVRWYFTIDGVGGYLYEKNKEGL